MDGQGSLFPKDLTGRQLDDLNSCIHEARDLALEDLLQRAQGHLTEARAAAERDPLINVALAKAIVGVLEDVTGHWEELPVQSRSWLRGAMGYFTSGADEESDFGSPIGFEDDAEILNACLRHAERDDLCLNPEDYDDA